MNQTHKNEHNKQQQQKIKFFTEKFIFLEVETIHKYTENINNNNNIRFLYSNCE